MVRQADRAPATPRLEGSRSRCHVVLGDRGGRPADKDTLIRDKGDAVLIHDNAVVDTVAAILNVARLLGCKEAASYEMNNVLHVAAAGVGTMVVTRLRIVRVLLLSQGGRGHQGRLLCRGRHVGGEEGRTSSRAHHADHHTCRGGEGGVEGGRHGDFGEGLW